MEGKNAEETKKLIEFYDAYVPQQQTSGINDRIFGLYKRLLKAGLNKDSHVLELGCGIGAMTWLLARTVKKGVVEAVDISQESINFARRRIAQPNVEFTAQDILNYVPKNRKFDFITLFDLIEHVPVDSHPALFKNIASWADEETIILINIPNPEYIAYDIKTQSPFLQVIDQPIPLKQILDTLTASGLNLFFFESYSVWVEWDYQFFVIRKTKEFREITLSSKRNFLSKAKKKLEREFVKLKYPYR